MASMTDLSPAAQAVITAQAKERCLFEWSAVNDPPCHPSDSGWNGCVQCVDRRGVAAALRAAADQVVPQRRKPTDPDSWEEATWTAQQDTREELFAIAAELEGQ
jgi:hypothetical protein